MFITSTDNPVLLFFFLRHYELTTIAYGVTFVLTVVKTSLAPNSLLILTWIILFDPLKTPRIYFPSESLSQLPHFKKTVSPH